MATLNGQSFSSNRRSKIEQIGLPTNEKVAHFPWPSLAFLKVAFKVLIFGDIYTTPICFTAYFRAVAVSLFGRYGTK